MCDHLNLTVHDLKESIDWYKSVFGFEAVESGQYQSDSKMIKWAIIRRQNFMLCLYEDPTRKSIPETEATLHRIFHFGLAIQNLELFQACLRNRKLIPSVYGPIRYRHSTSWYINDPTGYEIEAVSWDNNQIRFS